MLSKEELKQVLIPTPGQWLISIMLAALTGVTLYRDHLFAGWLSRLFGDPYVRQVSSEHLSRISDLAATDYVVKVAFFGGIGFLAYVVYLVIANIMIEARNEVVVETDYVNKGQAQTRLFKPTIQILVAVLLVASLMASVFLLVPVWTAWFGNFLVLGGMSGIGWLIGSLLLGAANIYALWILGQIVFAID